MTSRFKLILISFILFSVIYYVRVTVQQNKAQDLHDIHIGERGNKKIANFLQAKKIAYKMYKNKQRTFYCDCPYLGKQIIYDTCSYHPRDESNIRSLRVEWEHIVPVSFFGRSFLSWKRGHKKCRSNKKRAFKGRKCARLVSSEFRKIEADLYNLVPVIGELNARRSNYPMGLLERALIPLGNVCQTFVADGMVQPRKSIRGLIARTYKYMDNSYPYRGIISNRNRKLFDRWDNKYPLSEDEIKRAKKIERIQGNRNHYVVK